MANDVKFEGKERRMAKIEKCLAEYGIASLEDAQDFLDLGASRLGTSRIVKLVKGQQATGY